MKNKLKSIRKEHKMTQQDLADLVGVSRQTINMVENNKYDPSLHLAMTIARYLNLHVEDIFLLEEDDS
ncbi:MULTISPECIES: helix-turn-helix transcriptional regulator [Aerococcus]|uniref:Transcriptional regulator n=2 Tax=Aerococcus TaxID=1375 RepID=A0A178HI81_9LACT|nr:MULTISPECIES: helix-turn-helix transcriptional regulator [Aerococcus]KAA9219693.1 helix-turn-helix transcriptional regulator [Aerococcus loyolae]KAA9263997.1 helix-turn-helix transcriptional regulator [Aerococcus loyolae]MCY3025534.1 helix-turn-helix transcriptional regulator [Aerococcus loyolae]MCY3026520.1 helix-turn-helix transcriptional regulator [Aerococcus loyolae]MCY3028372.1 helix-turn-helix transcriptional regulator [Aerococcus loyolae]